MEQWGSVFRALAEKVEAIARWLHPWYQALNEIGRSPEIQRLAHGLGALVRLSEVAPAYCTPYQRELRRLGLPPLTRHEESCAMMAAALLRDRRGVQLGQRPPLEQVALLVERLDVATAVVLERHATQSAVRWFEKRNRLDVGELTGAAYLELQAHIVPSMRRRIERVPMADFSRRARPVLEQMARDAYLARSILRALARQLRKEEERRQLEHPLTEADEHSGDGERGDHHERYWDVQRALASFLKRPRATDLDRKLVAELRRQPDSSAREIAGRIGESARTVQYHRRKLLEHVRKQLEA